MSKCTDHCYHKECLDRQLNGKDNLRCAVCSYIYGVLIGEMPPGLMTWYLEKHKGMLDGYPGVGAWVIEYSFRNGVLPNGKHYSGTGR